MIRATRRVALALPLAAGPALAQQEYPQRPLRMLVPYAPGGMTDVLARSVAQGMGAPLGQAVVAENRPGANTIIASQLAAQAAPDGYTILMTSGAGYVVNPLIYARMPVDVRRDLRVIAILVDMPFVMVVNGASPIRSVAELVAYGRSKREGLTFAAVGRGNPLQLSGEMFRLAAGVDMTSVIYNGSAPSYLALQSGDADLMFDVVGSVRPMLADGKLRAIAITSAERLPQLPDVPTMAEQGFPQIQASTWFGIAVPRATPEPVVERLRGAIADATAGSAFQQRFANFGVQVRQPEPQGVIDGLLATESDRWARVIREANLSLEELR